MNDSFPKEAKAGGLPCSGPGALCAEAQADGVPCSELGRECEVCERALKDYDGEPSGSATPLSQPGPGSTDW